jgi:tetratricopeptide (TPR) repeat protein
MKPIFVTSLAIACLGAGTLLGYAAKVSGGGVAVFKGKPARDGAYAALAEAEKLAGKGSWELIGVGRVYYLSGDKTRGQAVFDRVLTAKPESSDYQRLGDIYAEAHENDKADEYYQKVLAADTKGKDDTAAAEIGAYYIRTGRRDKGEELFAKALARNPGENWHYVRAAEALLEVPRQ